MTTIISDIERSKLTNIFREIVGRVEDPTSRDDLKKPSTYELEQVAERAREGLDILKGLEPKGKA